MKLAFNLTESESWFLKIGPNKAGPYSIQQIQTLLEDGEIQPFHKVTNENLSGEWITAQELILAFNEAQANAKREAQAEEERRRQDTITFSGSFQPPIRPADIGKVTPRKMSTDPGADPALSLFDTIQAVRERKTTALKQQITPPSSKASQNSLQRFFSSQISIIIALTLTLGLAAWGLLKVAEKNLKPAAKSPPGTSEKSNTSTPHPGTTPPTTPAIPSKMDSPLHPTPLKPPKPLTPSLKSLLQPKKPPEPPLIKKETPPPQEPERDRRDEPDPRDEPPRPEDEERDFPQNHEPPPPEPPLNGDQPPPPPPL